MGLEPQSETVLQMPEGISNYFPENQSAVAISEVDHRTLTIKPLTGETEQRLFLRGASGKMYIAKLSTKLRHVPLIEVQDSSLATTAAAIPATGGSSISSSYLLVQMIRNKPLPGFTVSPWTRQILEGDEFTITGEHVWSSVNMTGVVARVTRASGVSKSVRINPDSLQINIPAFGQMRLISADRWTLDNGADTAIAQLVFTKD